MKSPMRYVICCLVMWCSVAAAQTETELRTWTSADGKFTTRAELVDMQDKQVTLRKENGAEVTVSVESLSYPDRLHIRSELRRRSQEPAATEATSIATTAVAGASDWPRWRGINLDGKSTEKGLLNSWPEDGPQLLWQVEGIGTGYASQAVTDGKIFTMGRRNGTEFLIALNADNGSEVWATPLGPGRNQRGSNCTPTVDGDLVFGVSIEGDLLCARTDNGQEVWRKNYAQDFGGKMMSSWGFSESPLVDGDRLICTPGGPQAILAALDKRTGRVAWTTAMPYGGSHGGDGAAYSSIVISNGAGVKQYVQLVGRGLIGVDAASGQLLWRYDRIANGTANIPTPIVDGDYVFCSSGYGTGAALLKLARNGRGVGFEEVYFLDANRLQNHHGGMVLVDGKIYCGHGHNNGFPICVDMSTGRTVWGGDQRGAGSGSAAVTYADGHLYFRYQDGKMALIEATPERYNLKGVFKLASVRAESWPHPVIVDGKLYIRDQEAMLCYDLRSP